MQPVPCEACGKSIILPDPSFPRLCEPCAHAAGLAYPQPSRRPLVPCVRCQHDELLRVMPRDRTIKGGQAYETTVPMALTYATAEQVTTTIFNTKREPSAIPDLEQAYGVLECWVCRRCGFSEWYAQLPERIPVGAQHGTTLVKVPRG